MPSYATVVEYELRTGTDVPVDQEPTVQRRLDDVSALIELYLGDCADEVATAYPDILSMVTVANVYRVSSVPAGVKAESVGGTSVTYDTDNTAMSLLDVDTALLDTLIERTCGQTTVRGVGQYGVGLGGEPETGDDWPADVDFWVLSGGYRK
jgi:hypothetical protein